ncbi:MAG TPA: di-trans,poly-cis-decaprenylcistransferase [Chloroflexi bacterium]|nr:di-trans,poly-cis-decaprenylcistransferase [Chloroflexota bacterium]
MAKASVGETIPRSIGIIMDGNGRWAQARGLARFEGHRAGVQAARRAVETCARLGVASLTLFTFSTENWERPSSEVSFLMRLAEDFARRELPTLQRNGVRLRHLGRREGLPATLLSALDHAMWETRDNNHMSLFLALNYGGRAEILDAIKALLVLRERVGVDATNIGESTLARYLYAPELFEVDLIIRSGGEQRLSNFLIWQAVGAVLWSTPVLWPDFQADDILQAIEVYREQCAETRFP